MAKYSFFRCHCGNCQIMPTVQECICCQEVQPVVAKINELLDPTVQCITTHPGFTSVVSTDGYYRQHFTHTDNTMEIITMVK